MRKNILLAIIFWIGMFSNSKAQNYIGLVNKIQGFYIFTDSQPLSDYDVIGEVSSTGQEDRDIIESGGQYQPVRDYLIRIARQSNYTADGLILSLVNGGTDRAVIIKFKETVQNKNQSKVSQYQGLYLFVDSEPLKDITYLGTVKSRTSFSSSQYSVLRDKLIRKSKSDYPDAKGLIMKFVSGGIDTADAVKFEN
jgi:hypothetical protein